MNRIGRVTIGLFTREREGANIPRYLSILARDLLSNFRRIQAAINRNSEDTSSKMRHWFLP